MQAPTASFFFKKKAMPASFIHQIILLHHLLIRRAAPRRRRAEQPCLAQQRFLAKEQGLMGRIYAHGEQRGSVAWDHRGRELNPRRAWPRFTARAGEQ